MSMTFLFPLYLPEVMNMRTSFHSYLSLLLLTLRQSILIILGFALGSFCSGLVSDRFGRKTAIWGASVTMLVFGVITAFVPWYPLFVFTWWVTGTMAIACYTAAFVWTMEIAAGKWKIYLGMSMNYSWPTCRLIIAGETENI